MHLSGQVHPDKTSCFGAESAFQLVGQAVSELTAASVPAAQGYSSNGEDGFGDWTDAFFGDLEPPCKRQRKSPSPVAAGPTNLFRLFVPVC